MIDEASCASCTDGIQNGDETGIDCGGSFCPLCIIAGADCPEILNLKAMTIISGRYTADSLLQSNNLINLGCNVIFESGTNIELQLN